MSEVGNNKKKQHPPSSKFNFHIAFRKNFNKAEKVSSVPSDFYLSLFNTRHTFCSSIEIRLHDKRQHIHRKLMNVNTSHGVSSLFGFGILNTRIFYNFRSVAGGSKTQPKHKPGRLRRSDRINFISAALCRVCSRIGKYVVLVNK